MSDKPVIVFDATKTKNLASGLGNFCYNLGKEIASLPHPNFEVHFLVEKEQINIFGEQHTYITLRASHKFPLNNFREASLIHACWQLSSLQSSNKKLKWLYTLHDLNFKIKYKGFKRVYYTNKLLNNIYRAHEIVCISKATQDNFQKHIGTSFHSDIIYNGGSLSTIQNEKPTSIELPKRYIFFIGIISDKKNLEIAFKMLQQIPDLYLVIAGEAHENYKKQLIILSEQLGILNRIIYTGKVTDEEKLYLFNRCEAYINPSVAEGFGIPVAEAMSIGKPIILSDIPPFHEIAEDDALYITSETLENFSSEYKNYIERFKNESCGEKLRIHAKKFSWKNAAESYLKLYEKILLED